MAVGGGSKEAGGHGERHGVAECPERGPAGIVRAMPRRERARRRRRQGTPPPRLTVQLARVISLPRRPGPHLDGAFADALAAAVDAFVARVVTALVLSPSMSSKCDTASSALEPGMSSPTAFKHSPRSSLCCSSTSARRRAAWNDAYGRTLHQPARNYGVESSNSKPPPRTRAAGAARRGARVLQDGARGLAGGGARRALRRRRASTLRRARTPPPTPPPSPPAPRRRAAPK